MLSLTRLLLAVACAALVQVGCEARRYKHRHFYFRNSNDASIALGSITGSDSRPLPVLIINGPDIIIGFPNSCAPDGHWLFGTQVVVSNNNRGTPPDLSAVNPDDAQSALSIHCAEEANGSRCSDGVSVTSYQYCGSDPPTPTTTAKPTTSGRRKPDDDLGYVPET